MSDEDFQRLLAAIAALSPKQRDTLAALLQGAATETATETPAGDGDGGASAAGTAAEAADPIAEIEHRFAAEPCCPKCGSAAEVGKWGSANGLRRYRCKPCKTTFNCLTGTPLAQLHKRELWFDHAQALVDGISLRKVAARIGVHAETAFRWRHRFLAAPKLLKARKLEGTVEADETYFLHSEKGARKLSRPPRKRGGAAAKRGLSDEQVPVLIARDGTRAVTDQILADRSALSIAAVLGPVLDKEAILVSDGAGAYRAFADKAEVVHVALNLSAGERMWGVYHIQNVNNYCSRLKTWMRRFNGVATKYLDSYLGWHRAKDRDGDTLDASSLLVAAYG